MKFYKHFHAEHKDFDKRHFSYQYKIQGLKGKLKGLFTYIQDLEVEVEDVKALDNEGLKKLAKNGRAIGFGDKCAQPQRSAGVWEGAMN